MLRVAMASLGSVGIVSFFATRPASPDPGSDCEAISSWVLREPVTAVTALAIVGAGWAVASQRPVAGSAVLVAGMASFAAHATAHPGARALDGITAGVAVAAVIVSLVHTPPMGGRLVVAGLIAGTGAVVWQLTRSGAPLCDTLGRWGHGAWHLLIALSVLTLGLALPPTSRWWPYPLSDQ